MASEGKTTIVVNLGAVMSMSNKKTIILNLDMRKPTLHKKFDTDNEKGLSEVLSDSMELSEVIQHTKYPNLDIITSGPIPPNPRITSYNVCYTKLLRAHKKARTTTPA